MNNQNSIQFIYVGSNPFLNRCYLKILKGFYYFRV